MSFKLSLVLLAVGLAIGQKDITNDPIVRQLKKVAWYAAAAHCSDQELIDYKCKACQVKGTTFIKSFNSQVLFTRGYLARNENNRELIISFRGTDTNVNTLFDLDALMVPFGTPFNPKGNVHKGFYTNMKSMVSQFIREVEEALTNHPEYSIIITGHSLGGGIASLAIEEIRTRLNVPDTKIQLITYGQPKTGDAKFAKWFNAQAFDTYRVVNNEDRVPHIYAQNLIGYEHHWHEIWIKGYNQSQRVISCRDIDFEDPNCSASIPIFQLDNGAHLTYFNTIFGANAC